MRSFLEQADGAGALPRLGGMARPNGVMIVSERFWAFSGTDGRLVEGRMPELPAAVRRVPLVRGLGRLTLSFVPLMRREGPTRRLERVSLLLAMLFRGRTLALHGAEHRAIAAAEARQLAGTWDGSARPSRFSLRCGTNFAALAAPVT